MKDSIKKYFESEISSVSTPPMPTFNKKKSIIPLDNILLTALAVASMVLVYLPTSYNSKIRDIGISNKVKNIIKDEFTRVIQSTDLYFIEKRGENK